jgi:hypothetical protein
MPMIDVYAAAETFPIPIRFPRISQRQSCVRGRFPTCRCWIKSLGCGSGGAELSYCMSGDGGIRVWPRIPSTTNATSSM